MDENIKEEEIRQYISSIPKIKIHYVRANTLKHFIDESNSICVIHRYYEADCKVKIINWQLRIILSNFHQRFQYIIFPTKARLV